MKRKDLSRAEKIRYLIDIFLTLAEDPQDGTPFDCDVLDVLEKLEKRYRMDKNDPIYR